MLLKSIASAIEDGKEMLVGITLDELKWYQGYLVAYQNTYSAIATGDF